MGIEQLWKTTMSRLLYKSQQSRYWQPFRLHFMHAYTSPTNYCQPTLYSAQGKLSLAAAYRVGTAFLGDTDLAALASAKNGSQ